MQSGAPLGVALIGCGEVTRAKHLPALCSLPEVRVLAVADPDRERREQTGDRFRIPRRLPGVEAVLELEGIDAVGIATPPASHLEVALPAIEAGKHVWIDKPLALRREDCLELVRAAQPRQRVAVVGFHMRFHRLVRELRARIQAAGLGRIESIRSVWFSPRSDEGLPEWRRARENGGGALVEIGVHHYDLWRFLLGAEVEEVSALGRDGSRHDETAVIAARLTGGILASAVLSERTSHEIEIEVCGSEGRLRAGCLKFDGIEFLPIGAAPGDAGNRLARGAHLLRSLPRGLYSMARGGEYRESYREAWRRFAAAAREGQPSPCPLEEGLRASEVTWAAVESRMRGTPVRVVREGPVPGEARRKEERTLAGPFTLEPRPDGGSSRPLLSVVAPTYNRPSAVEALLEALSAQRFPCRDFEVILVDDGGVEPLGEIVARRREGLNLTLLAVKHGGCSAARQAGVMKARGDWLVFTDDDCRPAPDWLDEIARAARSSPDCAIAGSVVNGVRSNLYSEATQTLLDYLDYHFHREGVLRYSPTYNIAFPAGRLLALGGMSGDWPVAGGEDRELCARWTAAQGRIVRAPRALVVHCHPLGWRSFWRQHFQYGRGARLFRVRAAQGLGAAPPLGSPGFYLGIPLFPFRRNPFARALGLAGLLLLAQAANLLGFLRQAASGAGGERRCSEAGPQALP
jgi:predicted dehydrogenase/GT2 family glycosyltransferase